MDNQDGFNLKNTRVEIFCDNKSVMYMVNNHTTHCEKCMKLIRILTMDNLKNNNRRILVKHVISEENVLADALSRHNLKKFWEKAPTDMRNQPDPINKAVWPVTKIWNEPMDKLLQEIFMIMILNISGQRTKQRTKMNSAASLSGDSSTISTREMQLIVDKLKCERNRSSTKANYYGIWKKFNEFFIRLDDKPSTWEERIGTLCGIFSK